MSSEPLIAAAGSHLPVRSESMPAADSLPYSSSRHRAEQAWVFEELPKATVVSVSRPETGDISPMLLSYTIEFQYKQFKWLLLKKASKVLYLHFTLKKRAIIEEFHEKQDQAKEWLQHLGIVDHIAVVRDDDDDDEGSFSLHLHREGSVRNRNVPSSSAALPIIRPALSRQQQTISDRAKEAMQGYLNHFLGNLDIVNSREVCKFVEVSKLSFKQEYGPKLKEGYLWVKHLSNVSRTDDGTGCCSYDWFGCCKNNWQKVWAVLKPGFLALLEDPFSTKLLDIIVFDVLPASNGDIGSQIYLAYPTKERNPLLYVFKVSCGNRSINFRTTNGPKVKEWVSAINDAVLKPHEGWCHPHRFGSFAPPRGLSEDGSQVQWLIDGQAAFEAIASAIEDAKSEIFITGWWLCPELYLRRSFQDHASSRLDALLEEKAKQGVQIYILLYKEVAIALKINSLYSKKRLCSIHENVQVLRYPDHFSTGVYLWSHHEKLVIVDYQICFIGGLDLCFGRYDTIEHKVGDHPPHIWPGKDYYNPRESEPNSWEDTMKDELDRTKYPRMPWHDVHCALWGPPCRDVARHFVQRWNHAKRNKALNEQTIPLLMPQHHMVIPHYLGKSREINIGNNNAEENKNEVKGRDICNSGSPLQDIPLLLPPASVDSEAQEKLNSKDTNLLNQPTRVIGSSFSSLQKSEVEGSVPNAQMEDLDFMYLHSEMNLNSVTESHEKSSDDWCEPPGEGECDASADEYGQVGPRVACRCQVTRSVSQWSAGTSRTEESIHSSYCSFIEKAEHFIYIENQFFISGLSGDEIIQNRVAEALYNRIRRAHKEQSCFRVIVVIPLLPGFQGGLDDSGAATVRALMHWQYRTISWKNTSILHKLSMLLGSKTNDYISFYGLRSHGKLFDGGPVVTSQVYVHSKVLIIDDRVALIGSSNINDRSLLGSRDSEIGLVIEDKEFLDSSMNGEPWKAGKFTHSLRCSLWSEHLGLHAREMSRIIDPVAETTYKDLWLATAKENTKIYHDVFACIPNDLIHSRAALRQSISHWKEKLGHTTIDLGVAPGRLEWEEKGVVRETDPEERLKAVKGHLVCLPLEFLCEEDLRPVFNEGEFYAPLVFL